MSSFKFLIQFLSVAAVCHIAASMAFAQANQPASSGGGGSGGLEYAFPYLIVVLGLLLGMLVVARSSSRREREKPAGYVGKNIMEDE
jgi:hypothetical protein